MENLLSELIAAAFDPPPTVARVRDAGGGRGIFSYVVRIELDWPTGEPADHQPHTVVAKLPGPNRAAALSAGAFERESLAYRDLLPRSPVAAPHCYAQVRLDDGAVAFLLEDLGHLRAVDQLHGLDESALLRVAKELAVFHRAWADEAAELPVRRHTPALIPEAGLRSGLDALTTRWADAVDAAPFARLLEQRSSLVERFATEPATLCHGDPRADNLVFDDRLVFSQDLANRSVVLFDWQQVAVQLGEADLAWLLATSATPATRRASEPAVIAAYAEGREQPLEETRHRYRIGSLLPGLAVLMLAQRDVTDARTEAFITTSLERIGAMVNDVDL